MCSPPSSKTAISVFFSVLPRGQGPIPLHSSNFTISATHISSLEDMQTPSRRKKHMKFKGENSCPQNSWSSWCLELQAVPHSSTQMFFSKVQLLHPISQVGCPFLLQKVVRDPCVYYQIQDNTGVMEVLVFGHLSRIPCESGDRVELTCFELGENQLRSVIHSFLKVRRWEMLFYQN